MRFFIHLALILALITAAASPACKFISGASNTIEICAADGSLKTIQAPDDYQSPMPQKQADHKTIDPCGFCFAAAYGKTVTPSAIAIIIPVTPDVINLPVTLASIYIERSELAGIEARPPPSFS